MLTRRKNDTKQLRVLSKPVLSLAKRQHLVRLGRVRAEDAHQPIHGFMFLPRRQDVAFCGGHVHDLDLMVVVRQVTLPGDTKVVRLILDFRVPFNFPHIVALGDAHQEHTLKSLLAGYHHYRRADIDHWRVFTPAIYVAHVIELRDMMHALHLQQVNDIEFEGPHLRLYLADLFAESQLDSLIDFINSSVIHTKATT